MAGPASTRPHAQQLLLCGLGAPRRSRRAKQVPTRVEAALPLSWRALLQRGPTRSCCCYKKGWDTVCDAPHRPPCRGGSTEQTGLDTIALWSSVMLIISHPQGLYLSSFCLHASPYYASPLRPLFALWQPNYIYCRPHSCVLGFWVHQHLLKGLVFCCRWHA
jgi:hypothetical protein